MIAGKEESDSNECQTEKQLNVTYLMMPTKTSHNGSPLVSDSCFGDQSLPTHSYIGRDAVSHGFVTQDHSSRPVFVEKPKSLTAEEGQYIKFTCRLKGQPLPVVRWEKDGCQITGERFQITNDGDIFSLEIAHSILSDAGRYICIATNDSGEARSMVSLIVQKGSGQASKFQPKNFKSSVDARNPVRTFNLRPMDQLSFNPQSPEKKLMDAPSKPSVVFQELEYSAVAGGRVCMSCNISGIPQPKVTWLGEMQIIEPSETIHVTYHPGISSLELVSVSASDGGTYICQAENDLGVSCARCQLLIQNVAENSSLQQHSKKIHVEHDANVMNESSQLGRDRSIHSNDIQMLAVESANNDAGLHHLQSVNSRESSDAMSQKDGGHFSEKVSAYMPSSQLDILNSIGTYSCLKDTELKVKSTGKAADDEKHCEYDDDDDAFEEPSNELNSQRCDEPPLIEDLQPENINVLRGSEFQLIAKFCGHPTPQDKWCKGSEALILDDRIRIETKPHCSILTVLNAQPQDTGIYTFTLINEFGQDKQHSSVTVEDRPEPPVGPPAVTNILEDSLVLSWSGSSYDGGCSVIKYKVEVSHNNADIWECLTDDCQHTTYHVLNLSRDTEYIFRVSAANKHGFSIPGCSSDPIVTNKVKKSIPTEDFPFLPRSVSLEKDRKFSDFYTSGEVIGKGKFGSVYKCREKSSDRLFAAKFIRMKSNQCKEFRQEIEIMNELHHPKLLLLWDAFESTREIILIMEHVTGGELMERIINDDYDLTERECIHFMRQICEGIVYIHSRSILHLDLKPENILCLTPKSNEIKIIDFGLARKFDPKKDFRIMFGTAEFVAPEVINYDTISFTTDMWSIGVICYILLSGLSPFVGDNDKETLVNVTKAQFDFDDDTFDDITDDAKDFINKLLVKDPRKRLLSEESLKHQWLAQDVTFMQAKKLSTDKHKKFMARRKWQKTGHALMALRRMVGLQRTTSNNLESCRFTGSSSSQTDSNSIVSDPCERISESDDSGFHSCLAQSLDSKSIPAASKHRETSAGYEATEDKNTAEPRCVLVSNFETSLHDKTDVQAISEKPSTMKNIFRISEFLPDAKTEVDKLEYVLESSKTEILYGKMDVENKEDKETTSQVGLIHIPSAKDGTEGITERTCTQFEETIQLPERIPAVQSEIPCAKATDALCKKFVEPSVSLPADQFRRTLFTRRSFDLKTTAKLNESLFRSFDQPETSKFSEKLAQARKVFESPNTSVITQRIPINREHPIKTSIFEYKPGTKTVPPSDNITKPQVAFGHTNLNAKLVESSSVAARKLAAQQFTAQRYTKPKKAPTFVRKMKNLYAVEGDIAKCEVLVDGNPSPTVSWFKDGKEVLELPQKYKTEFNDSGKHSLTIMNCGEDDDAEYSCKASNSLGTVTTKANLYVEPVGEVIDSNSLPRKK